jgi:hypothetical protein
MSGSEWDYRLVQTQYRNEWGELCDNVFIAKVEYEDGEPVWHEAVDVRRDMQDRTPFNMKYKRIRAAITKPILYYDIKTNTLI